MAKFTLAHTTQHIAIFWGGLGLLTSVAFIAALVLR